MTVRETDSIEFAILKLMTQEVDPLAKAIEYEFLCN